MLKHDDWSLGEFLLIACSADWRIRVTKNGCALRETKSNNAIKSNVRKSHVRSSENLPSLILRVLTQKKRVVWTPQKYVNL
jgi:hypothetical protein